MDCPDQTLVGKSIADIPVERGEHEVNTFLDLIIDFGRKLCWRTVIANHRDAVACRIVNDPSVLIGFSDAGAHLRNMAFYNFSLHMLKFAVDGKPALTPEQAVWRCSGEIADWFNLETGKLRLGDQADVAIIDPVALKATDLEAYDEAPIEVFGGLSRVVNRHDNVVIATIINGQVAYEAGRFHPELGKTPRFGRFLARKKPEKTL